MIEYGTDYPNDDEGENQPLDVAAFPQLAPEALQGFTGQVVNAVAPHTEAHTAAILAQLLAAVGAHIGPDTYCLVANSRHPARLYPLIVGRTSDGAKGTSAEVVHAIIAAAETHSTSGQPLRELSGLSSGEGLIDTVRDGTGDNPDSREFDEGIADKRLLVIETEFASVLAVLERQGSILPRVIRDAWDGKALRTMTRSPLVATDPHITIVGHVTPRELKLKLSEAQTYGGTMNRFLAIASRRSKLLPDGGNVPEDLLRDLGQDLAAVMDKARRLGRIERTEAGQKLWAAHYGRLSAARPDGIVSSTLARAAPQVIRLSLAYALVDGYSVIDEQHVTAALALWSYVEHTTEWMFGKVHDTEALAALEAYIAASATQGRTRTEISTEHFNRNKTKAEISELLTQLLKDGRIREETSKAGPGRPTTRYFT